MQLQYLLLLQYLLHWLPWVQMLVFCFFLYTIWFWTNYQICTCMPLLFFFFFYTSFSDDFFYLLIRTVPPVQCIVFVTLCLGTLCVYVYALMIASDWPSYWMFSTFQISLLCFQISLFYVSNLICISESIVSVESAFCVHDFVVVLFVCLGGWMGWIRFLHSHTHTHTHTHTPAWK